MKIVGLTGGIGSGKTTVSTMFRDLGVPVYISDERAKYLMNTCDEVRAEILQAFGSESYNSDGLNRKYISDLVFKDNTALAKINQIVHPAVFENFNQWLAQQTGPYVIKEVAVIFEYRYQDQYDIIITVIADIETRIKRLLKRDNTSREKILEIMSMQLSDEEKVKSSDFVINNITLEETQKSVLEIHRILSESGQNQ